MAQTRGVAGAGSTPAPRRALWHGLALIVVLALGVAARFYHLDVSPPGLYYDEAYYALDAVTVRNGARPIYFDSNNGREPLFIYSVALSQTWLGDTAYAVRVVAAIYGALALVAGYGAARVLFGPRTALLATALHAGSLWAILFSRIGLRVTTVPLVVGLMLLATASGWRRRSHALVALGGALLGLCFYTYIAARLIPLVFIALGVFWFVFRRDTFPRWQWLVMFGLSAVVVALPMAVYAVGHPDVYFGRAGQVALPLGEVLANLARVGGMFFWHGDDNWRHNLAGRPVFDPLTAIAFGAGLVWVAWRLWRHKDLRAALIALWLVVLMLPTALSDKAPHFLRALALTPVVYLTAALALEPLETLMRRRLGAGRAATWIVVCGVGVALVHGAATAQALQVLEASDARRYAFETAAVELAQTAMTCLATPAQAAWVDQRLWDRYPSVRYLASRATPVDFAQVVQAPPESACVFVPNGQPAALVLAHWAQPVRVRVEPGGLDQADAATAPYPLYNTFQIAPRLELQSRAVFADGAALVSVDVAQTEAGLRLRLIWSTATPLPPGLHSFVHWRDGDRMLAQADGPLGGDGYPAETWRVADQVEQVIELTGVGTPTAEVRVGVYDFASGERLLTGDGRDQIVVWP